MKLELYKQKEKNLLSTFSNNKTKLSNQSIDLDFSLGGTIYFNNVCASVENICWDKEKNLVSGLFILKGSLDPVVVYTKDLQCIEDLKEAKYSWQTFHS